MRHAGHIIKALWTMLVVACAAVACISDGGMDGGGMEPSEMVTLSISVPGSEPRTRALAGEGDEARVDVVDVLQFETGGGRLLHRAVGSGIDASGLPITTFAATLVAGECNLVVIANARDAVDAAMSSMTGLGMQEALDELMLTVGAEEKITGTGSDVEFLPMFGLKRGVAVGEEGLDDDDAVDMLRMVARIDVVLDEAVQNFRIAEVWLCNQPLVGWIGVGLYDWESVDEVDEKDEYTATLPYLADVTRFEKAESGFEGSVPTDAIYYFDEEEDNLTDRGITRSIYTFEAPAGSDTGEATNTCLIVGGVVDGTSDESYYRIDMKNGEGEYLPILRNHNYVFTVTSVEGPGAPTPEVALEGHAQVIYWELAEEDVIIDRQFSLDLDRDEVFLEADGTGMESIFAETDYDIDDRGFPAGIVVEVVTDGGAPDWLVVSPLGETGAFEQTVSFSATSANESETARRAQVKVKAGNMTKIVYVTQRVPPISGFGLAPPGVIGIKHSDLIALRDGQYSLANDEYGLTIRGSSTYANVDLPFVTNGEFGGLENEPVYAVLFKWGSMIAMADNTQAASRAFSVEDIVWVNSEFTGNLTGNPHDVYTNGFTAAARIDDPEDANFGDNEIIPNPALGHGDPCALFTSGDRDLFFGNGKRWRTPKGGPWQYSDGRQPFGDVHDWYSWSNPTIFTLAEFVYISAIDGEIVTVPENSQIDNVDSKIYGTLTKDGGTLFMPSLGYRNGQGGQLQNVNEKYGFYLSSTGGLVGWDPNNPGPYHLRFNPSEVLPRGEPGRMYEAGYAVRCVEAAAVTP